MSNTLNEELIVFVEKSKPQNITLNKAEREFLV